MQPKERVIGREAVCHALAVLVQQGLRAVTRQISPNEIVYVVMHLCHYALEAKEVTCGLLRQVPHEFRAKSNVLRPFIWVPAGYERQVPPKRVWDWPGKLEVSCGRGKGTGDDGTVRLEG